MINKKNKSSQLISVIIPSYNSANYIENCLDSLKKQSYQNFEVIVVDNNSNDGSAEIIKNKYPSVVLIRNSINAGFAKSCNIGIIQAKKINSWAIVLLNQDTIVESNFIKEGSKVLQFESVGLACPKITYGFTKNIWWAGGKLLRGRDLIYATSFRVHHHLNKKKILVDKILKNIETDFVTGCAMFVRTGVIDKVGLFDEKYYMYSEDIDLSLRIKKAGYRLLYFPSTIVHHMVEQGDKKSLGSKIRKAFIYLNSTARFVFKNYSMLDKIVWTIKLPIVLPMELKNLKKME